VLRGFGKRNFTSKTEGHSMQRLIAILMLVSASLVFAGNDVIPKTGGSCPAGYHDGKGAYCYKSSYGAQRNAIEKVGGKCPSGYSDGAGAYCYESSSSRQQGVVVKVDGKCPSGYRDGQGAYCYR
jgi:hypothetical protein